jgi:hypothetical protein
VLWKARRVMKKNLFRRRERKERKENLIELGILNGLGIKKKAFSTVS